VLQSLSFAVIVTDLEYRIQQGNPAAKTLLNAVDSNLVGESLFDLIQATNATISYPGSLSLAYAAAGSANSEPAPPALYSVRSRPGITIEMVSSSLSVGGQTTGHAHVLCDVTAQVRSAVAREEFLINVAHELRTPLAALRAWIDLLLEDYQTLEPREVRTMLRNMEKTSVKFQLLIESLTEAESIRAGKFFVRMAPVQLDDILLDAMNQTGAALWSHGQTIQLKQEGAVGLEIMADRRRILQVITNLIINASKYGPEDQPIVLSVCQSEGLAHVGVTDNGPGIPEAEQQQIFRRFYRSKNHHESGPGIGLGLGIVSEIVQAHGGIVHLASQPGKGTTFWFSLRQVSARADDGAVTAGGRIESSVSG
jgi:signal transduction histidine kinase